MLSTIYAYNAYKYIFYDSELVMKAVLANFNTSAATEIYEDSKFGMNSVRKLVTWVIAADGDYVLGT